MNSQSSYRAPMEQKCIDGVILAAAEEKRMVKERRT